MDAAISLYELTHRIRVALSNDMPSAYWVRAEVSEGRQNASGHYYCKFIDKDEKGNDVASADGVIWAGTFLSLRTKFEQATGRAFGSGMKVLVNVKVNFHKRYGLSLVVEDIDPSYTLGDMVRRRKEIIDKLTQEGVAEMNKQLTLPRPLLRIAVISSESAAGYGDFCKQLSHQGAMFNFAIQLFPSIMQGDGVENGIISALNGIAEEHNKWDAVVIIRGGGAVSDLNGFDTYPLAANIAQFPLPIITGIGHDRDETVLDLVANVRCKTPTAVADFLIEKAQEELSLLKDFAAQLQTSLKTQLVEENNRVNKVVSRLPLLFYKAIEEKKTRFRFVVNKMPSAAQNKCNSERSHCENISLMLKANYSRFIRYSTDELNNIVLRMHKSVPVMIQQQRQLLQSDERSLRMAGPERVFRLGFSLTTLNGKAVKDAALLKPGDEITTKFAKGDVKSIVK